MSSQPIIVQPGGGNQLSAFGNALSVMLNGEQTGGLLSVITEVTPPGGGPPLHVHHREAELFLVIEGQISYFAAGEWTEVRPGGLVYLPEGTTHRFRNIGRTPSRHWILTLPSGIEKFFSECAAEFAKPGGPDQEQIRAIHSAHGIQLIGQ